MPVAMFKVARCHQQRQRHFVETTEVPGNTIGILLEAFI